MDAAGALSSVEIWNFSKKYSLATAGVDPRLPGMKGLVPKFADGVVSLRSPQALRSVRVLDVQGKELANWQAGAQPRTELSIPVGAVKSGVLLLDVTGTQDRTSLTVAVP